jgi:hypothetical protein
MASVEKLGGSWVIVRADDSYVPGESRDSTAAEEGARRLFWTGDRWAPQYGLAKQFSAKQDAEAHLAQHRDDID